MGNPIDVLTNQVRLGNFWMGPSVLKTGKYDTTVRVGQVIVIVDTSSGRIAFTGPDGKICLYGPGKGHRWATKRFLKACRVSDVQFRDWTREAIAPVRLPA